MSNNVSKVTNTKTTDVKGTQVQLPCQLVVTVCREMADEFRPDTPSTSAGCFRAIAKPEAHIAGGGAMAACQSASSSSSQNNPPATHKKSSETSSPKAKRLKLDKSILNRILTVSVFTISTFQMMKSLEANLSTNENVEDTEDDQSDFARYRRHVLNRVYVVNNIFREGFMPSREGFLPQRPRNPAQREGLVAVSRPISYRRFYDNFFRPHTPGSRRHRRNNGIANLGRPNPPASDRNEVRNLTIRNRQRMLLDGVNIENQVIRMRRKQIEPQSNLNTVKIRSGNKAFKRKRCELEDSCDEDGNIPSTSSSATSNEDSQCNNEVVVRVAQGREDHSKQPYFLSIASTSSDFSSNTMEHDQLMKSPVCEENKTAPMEATSSKFLHIARKDLELKDNINEPTTSKGTIGRALKRFQDACDYYVTAISLKKRKLDDEADEFSKKQANSIWSSFPYFIAPSYVPRKNISKFSLESTNVHEDLSIQRYGDPPLFSWS